MLVVVDPEVYTIMFRWYDVHLSLSFPLPSCFSRVLSRVRVLARLARLTRSHVYASLAVLLSSPFVILVFFLIFSLRSPLSRISVSSVSCDRFLPSYIYLFVCLHYGRIPQSGNMLH